MASVDATGGPRVVIIGATGVLHHPAYPDILASTSSAAPSSTAPTGTTTCRVAGEPVGGDGDGR